MNPATILGHIQLVHMHPDVSCGVHVSICPSFPAHRSHHFQERTDNFHHVLLSTSFSSPTSSLLVSSSLASKNPVTTDKAGRNPNRSEMICRSLLLLRSNAASKVMLIKFCISWLEVFTAPASLLVTRSGTVLNF